MFFIQQPSARITGAGPSGERTDKPSGVSPCIGCIWSVAV